MFEVVNTDTVTSNISYKSFKRSFDSNQPALRENVSTELRKLYSINNLPCCFTAPKSDITYWISRFRPLRFPSTLIHSGPIKDDYFCNSRGNSLVYI
jgi:hypothetical protein